MRTGPPLSTVQFVRDKLCDFDSTYRFNESGVAGKGVGCCPKSYGAGRLNKNRARLPEWALARGITHFNTLFAY